MKPEENKFWGAEGKISFFLEQLFSLSVHTVRTKNGITLHFDEDIENKLSNLVELYGTEKEFFNILETTWQNDLIESVDININKVSDSGIITVNSNKLSEGEKQALIILGLNELVLKENSLALYDEPDTYQHPRWQREFITELENSSRGLGDIENDYIVTSHSPNIVSGIRKENLFVFEDGIIKDIPFDSYGKNVEAVLIDFFNVEGVRNKYVEELILEVQSLVNDKQFNSPLFKTKFNELKNILGQTAPEIIDINLEIAKYGKR